MNVVNPDVLFLAVIEWSSFVPPGQFESSTSVLHTMPKLAEAFVIIATLSKDRKYAL